MQWHIYSLVHLAMAYHRLARQMPRRSCNMFSYYCNMFHHNLCVTDTLPTVHHLRRRWYAEHGVCTAILNFGILYLWLYYRPFDRKLAKTFLVDPSRRQVGHPWYRKKGAKLRLFKTLHVAFIWAFSKIMFILYFLFLLQSVEIL